MGFLCHEADASLGDLIADAQRAGHDGDRAINELVRRFERLARKIGWQIARSRQYREDVEGAARFALTQAVHRHRGDARTFPAYARQHMLGAALREARRWREPEDHTLVEFDDVPTSLASAATVDDVVDQRGWGFGAVADAISVLRPAQQRLLERRYIDDADLADLAAESGVTVSAISQRLGTAHRHLHHTVAA